MRKLLFFISVSLLFSSCDFLWKEHVSGNGRVVTQERKTGAETYTINSLVGSKS